MVTESTHPAPVSSSPLSLAAQVAARSELQTLTLISGSMIRRASSPELHAERDPLVVEQEYAVKENSLSVTTRLEMSLNAPEGRVAVSAAYQAVYQLKEFDELSELAIDRFARINGLYNAWPYWREFVQSSFARMSLPPLTMPSLTAGTAVNILRLTSKSDTAEATEGGTP